MASIDGMEFTSVKAALEASEKRIVELEARVARLELGLSAIVGAYDGHPSARSRMAAEMADVARKSLADVR